MSFYSPASVYTATASANAAIAGPILVHKVVLINATPATVASSVTVFNATTASGVAKIALATDLYAATIARSYIAETFDPPVEFDSDGLSTTLAGSSGTTVKIYYTPA